MQPIPALSFVQTNDFWAYAAMPLSGEKSGVGSIYYVSSYFTTDATNPVTVEKYTEAEIAAIVSGYADGAEGYVKNVPQGAVIGMSVYGAETVLWFDAKGAAAIVSHADPLTLNAETGTMMTSGGEVVAVAMGK